MKRKWVDPDDAPPLTGKEIYRPSAKWRIGRKDVSPEEGKTAFRAALRGGKTRVNIHLDNDVIAHFKQVAGARGYQTLINAALRTFIDTGASQTRTSSALGLDITRQFNLPNDAYIQDILKTFAEAIANAARQSRYSNLNVMEITRTASSHSQIRLDAFRTQANNDFLAMPWKVLTNETNTPQ